MVKTLQFIAGTLVSINFIDLRDGTQSHRISFRESFNSAYCVGDEVSLPRTKGRCSGSLPRLGCTNLQCWECDDSERCCEQGSCSHSCWIPTIAEHKRFGKEVERSNLATSSAGVSCIEQAVLGTTFLGCRVWGLEYRQYNWWDGSGVSRASSG